MSIAVKKLLQIQSFHGTVITTNSWTCGSEVLFWRGLFTPAQICISLHLFLKGVWFSVRIYISWKTGAQDQGKYIPNTDGCVWQWLLSVWKRQEFWKVGSLLDCTRRNIQNSLLDFHQARRVKLPLQNQTTQGNWIGSSLDMTSAVFSDELVSCSKYMCECVCLRIRFCDWLPSH